MQVILLERIENLGQMGDLVTVKNGYARNYLLPQEKALRATKDNVAYFESQRAQLEASNLKKKKEAEKAAEKINGVEIALIRQASENGQLYGSIRSHDIREGLKEKGIHVEKSQIMISAPIKNIGLFPIRIKLHPEVDATISVNVAKSDDDAELQRAGDPSLIQSVENPDAPIDAAGTAEAPEGNAEEATKKKKKKSSAKSAKKESTEDSGSSDE